MTQTSYTSRTAETHPGIVQSLPAMRVSYEWSALDELFVDDVLAVIGFGGEAPLRHSDPRYVHVALQTDKPAPFEIWRAANLGVRTATAGALRWSTDDDYEFGVLELDEDACGGLAAAAEMAYAALSAHLADSGMPHPLRIWNYVDAINLGEGDNERYRQFCSGRAAGMRDGFKAGFPAATAIGLRDGRRVLQVYWLTARLAGTPIENPRQINAWRYPRQYGPDAPNFARAMRAPTNTAQVYISGTAAIVGHVSLHQDDFAAQLQETLANLDSVLGAADIAAAVRFRENALLKVYVRREEDLTTARKLIAASSAAPVPLLLLCGDICRRELLIEIDGVQGATANEALDSIAGASI